MVTNKKETTTTTHQNPIVFLTKKRVCNLF